jgi:hypothetical protein
MSTQPHSRNKYSKPGTYVESFGHLLTKHKFKGIPGTVRAQRMGGLER